MKKTFRNKNKFKLENGGSLPELEIAYHTYGTLNNSKSNVVWVCHALTANSDVFDWWKGLFGENDLFNPKDYFIVCANNLGSAYGTTGPLSKNKHTGDAWYSKFPVITIRDMVNAHDLLREYLGIEKIHTIIGGSQGGQQVLEWNIKNPDLFENTILIATNAQHSQWGIAFNESQRLAIKADRTYYGDFSEGGKKGLAAARSIALLSYRTYETYNTTQKENHDEKIIDFNSASYQRYQGKKLVDRFNAYSYVTLSQAMDSHNVGRARVSIKHALEKIKAKTLIIGVKTDNLFPIEEQQFLHLNIPNSSFSIIESKHGHDGFLIETKQLQVVITTFLQSNKKQNKHLQLI
ncbi:MAG: homoserine O-acetyltransferase [Bacteroidia bacterium]